MNKLTELERAQKVIAGFVPQDMPGCHYVYAYLGRASYDATQYEIIDGLCLASKRIWHLDECQTNCVAYIGLGVRDRINRAHRHPFVPSSESLRVKLVSHLSADDAIRLERELIQELGCLLDSSRSDGCLANTKLNQSGNDCSSSLRMEAAKYRTAITVAKRRGRFIVFTSDKSVIASGYLHQLPTQLKVSRGTLNRVLRNDRITFTSPLHKQPLFICDEDSYESFECRNSCNTVISSRLIIHAQHIWGGDIFIGTATELALQLSLPEPAALHRVARRYNGALQVNGYIAAYGKDPVLSEDEKFQINQRITICCNQNKEVLFIGSRAEAASRFKIPKYKIDERMQHQKDSAVYSPAINMYVYFVSYLRFADFIPLNVSSAVLTSKRVLRATSLDGSQSFIGTAQELKPLLGIERVDGLHISARSGGLRSSYGWRAVYLEH